jgi:cell division protein FtsQ
VKRPEGFDHPEVPAPPTDSRQRKPRRGNPTPDKSAQSGSTPDKSTPYMPTSDRSAQAGLPRPGQSNSPKPSRAARRTAKVEAAVEAQGSEVSARALERAQRRIARAEARRFTRSSRRRRLTWLTVGAIVVVLVTVLAVAIFSPILALRTITIEGATSVKVSAVQSALDDQLGTPLALLNTGEIDRDLSRFTLIRSYVTEIVPPNTLVVRIVERQAIGVIQDGSLYDQVDPAGVVLKKSTTAANLPVIDIGSATVGGAAFEAAVKVLLAMPASLSRQIDTISASTLDNVSLTFSGSKHTVIWGSSAQSNEKATVLAALLTVKQCRSMPVLNVTAPLVVACGHGTPTPKPSSTPTSTPSGTPTPSANQG